MARTKPTQQLNGIDVLKFLCSILVVMIHTNPFEDISSDFNYLVVNGATRIAVPFFFMCSGYFCFRFADAKNVTHRLFSSAWKMLRLYLLWTAIYGAQILYTCVLTNENGYIHGALGMIRTILFCGYEHLWYLHASFIAFLLTALVYKFHWRSAYILTAGFVLYLCGVLGDSYYSLLLPLEQIPVLWTILQLFFKVIVTTRNGLFEGFLFLNLGILFSQREISIKKTTASFFFALFFALMLAEAMMVEKFNLAMDHNMYVFLIPTVFSFSTSVCIGRYPIQGNVKNSVLIVLGSTIHTGVCFQLQS